MRNKVERLLNGDLSWLIFRDFRYSYFEYTIFIASFYFLSFNRVRESESSRERTRNTFIHPIMMRFRDLTIFFLFFLAATCLRSPGMLDGIQTPKQSPSPSPSVPCAKATNSARDRTLSRRLSLASSAVLCPQVDGYPVAAGGDRSWVLK